MRSALRRTGAGLGLGVALLGCGDGHDRERDKEKAPTVQTIRVIEHATTDAVTDNGPPGDSAGDVLTFANPLFDESNTRQVGTNQGYCVRVAVGQAWECLWTAFLETGQLTVEGPFFDTKGSTLAITGGTGDFQGARGQMQLEFRNPQGTEFDFIYQVQLEP